MNIQIEGPSAFLKTDGGWIGRIGTATVFFGDKTSTLAKLQGTHPAARFTFLNQIHSDLIHQVDEVPATIPTNFTAGDWPEGDAHITTLKNVALCIRTADCVPVLISTGKMVAALHAGWRGLEFEIIQKAVLKMRALGAEPRDLKAVVGPHIGKASFEVGRDVSEKLNTVYRKLRYNPAPITYTHPTDPDKRMVDLGLLAHAQLIQGGVSEKAVTLLKADTFAETSFRSYRRDKTAERQISFISLG